MRPTSLNDLPNPTLFRFPERMADENNIKVILRQLFEGIDLLYIHNFEQRILQCPMPGLKKIGVFTTRKNTMINRHNRSLG